MTSIYSTVSLHRRWYSLMTTLKISTACSVHLSPLVCVSHLCRFTARCRSCDIELLDCLLIVGSAGSTISAPLGFTQDMFNTQQAESEVLGLCSGKFAKNQSQTWTQQSVKQNQSQNWVEKAVDESQSQSRACESVEDQSQDEYELGHPISCLLFQRLAGVHVIYWNRYREEQSKTPRDGDEAPEAGTISRQKMRRKAALQFSDDEDDLQEVDGKT